MNDLIKKEDENNKYIIKYDSTHNLPKPFERFIFLLETTVAGTTCIKDIDKIIDSLNIGYLGEEKFLTTIYDAFSKKIFDGKSFNDIYGVEI